MAQKSRAKSAPLKPRPHQVEAVRAAVQGLHKHKRGQVIMACGTGKTLVGQIVADKMRAQTLLVFVPSLLLARQILNVYSRQWPRASYLAVCSNIDRVASEDAPDAGEIGCEATTDGAEVHKFLRTKGRKVVIATYQSARVLEGLKFDGAIFDEAHRTAGAKGKPFAFGLHDSNIKCGWRLFMTATPRHSVIVSEEGALEKVYSMDDPQLYGPELYTLSFRKAIDLCLIVDYRIVVSVFKLPKDPGATATQIALRKAMSRYKASKVFTFHNTIARASSFVEESSKALQGVHLSHVNGTQPNADRVRALRDFADATQGIVTNVRCLTEGVDLPSCDMVAFMDRKKSKVEIVQALGRAMRTSLGKKRALIFLPIFVQEDEGEDFETALHRTDFIKLYEILQALREQDSTFTAELDKIKQGSSTALPPHVSLDIDEDLFRGVNAQKVVERIRQYVTVRMLRPFGLRYSRMPDYEEAKKEVLALARKGVPRKGNHLIERVIVACRNRARVMTFDPEYLNLLRQTAPEWFIGKSHKKALRAYAANGGEKPAKGTDLFCTFLLCTPSRRGYDPALRADLLKMNIAPEWFPEERLRVFEKYLLESARMKVVGLPRMSGWETRTFKQLTTPTHAKFDPKLTQTLKKKAPSWFLR